MTFEKVFIVILLEIRKIMKENDASVSSIIEKLANDVALYDFGSQKLKI